MSKQIGARTREKWVDDVKVIACILVVVGHFFQSMVKASILPDSGLYEWFITTVYYFHVPLFFICSGYLYQKYSKVNSVGSWRRNVAKKVLALGIPYVTFSTATWVLKKAFSSSVNNQIGGLGDDQNNLTEVVETKNIVKTATGAEADGKVIDVDSLVSMNMWGLTPDFLDMLEKGFKEFFEKEVPGNPLKAEYLIPIFIGELLEQGKMSVKVLKTNDTWYGMTYHEDVAVVKDSFKKMLENGVYKADLFSDL